MLPSASPSPHPYHHQNQLPSSSESIATGGGGGGPLLFNTINYQLAFGGSDIYDAATAAGASVAGQTLCLCPSHFLLN